MKTVLYRFLSVGALFLLAGQAAADEHPVLGQGNISCSSWLEGRQSDNAGPSRTAWVLGFMTAFNQYGSKSQADDVSEAGHDRVGVRGRSLECLWILARRVARLFVADSIR